VLEKNPDNVKIVFKHLPLRMHNMAETAARAAVAAQKQGKFWQMHDALFNSRPLSKKSIDEAAGTIGLDMEKFKKDMADPASRQQVLKDMMDASKADVSGTPTLFVNGHRVKDRSLPAIQAMIDKELKSKAKAKRPSP